MLKERSPYALGAHTLDKASTPLGTVADLFRIFNQAEGKSGRTVSWYDERQPAPALAAGLSIREVFLHHR